MPDFLAFIIQWGEWGQCTRSHIPDSSVNHLCCLPGGVRIVWELHWSCSSCTKLMIPHGGKGWGGAKTTARVSVSFQLANYWQTHQTIALRNTSPSLSPGQFQNGKAVGWEGYRVSTMGQTWFQDSGLAFKSFAFMSIYSSIYMGGSFWTLSFFPLLLCSSWITHFI